MLILPLQRRMTWANAPRVTLALIVLNVLVFVFLQGGDSRIMQQAAGYYLGSDLGRIEFPVYDAWLRDHDADPQHLDLMRRGPPIAKLSLLESDADFLDALHTDRLIAPDNPDYAAWKASRKHFEQIRARAFTSGHATRLSHVEPGRILWGMFMHGGVMHLLGNMFFLLVLGLLVEGALGGGWFLGLYLLGGIGATAGELALKWGEQGMLLGASGAIAALMGAFCVIWGLRKVRVFYWFFVIFDYVRVPALALLPVWLGWQIFELLTARNAQVAFGAHACGIASGALIALVLRRGGRVREDFLELDAREQQRRNNSLEYEQAMEHVGRLEISRARRLLEQIDREEPDQLRVLLALYRCASYGGSEAELDSAATRILQYRAHTEAEAQEQKTLLDEYLKACGGCLRIDPEILLGLVPRWLKRNMDNAAEGLLRTLDRCEAPRVKLAAAWFMLALRAPEGSAQRRARLDHLVEQFPKTAYAGKARILRQQDAGAP